MQVTSQTSSLGNQSVDREIYQASLLKKAVKAQGEQTLKLIESSEKMADREQGEGRESPVGNYLDERA